MRLRHCLVSFTPDQAIQNRPDFAAMREAEDGTSRHFDAARQFGRFRTEAEIRLDFMSTRLPLLATGT